MPYGTISNCTTVFLGGILGALLKQHFPKKLSEVMPGVFGLSIITMGLSLINKLENLTPVILAMIVGTIFGEFLNLDTSFIHGLHKLKSKLHFDMGEKQMDILISLTILFCFSGTSIFGTMNSAMTGDHTILYSKAVIDFFIAIIFGTTVGYLICFIAVPQLFVGIMIFYSSSFLVPLLNNAMIADFKACGGIITLAVGLKIAGIKKFHVLNMLPAIVLVLLFSYFWKLFM